MPEQTRMVPRPAAVIPEKRFCLYQQSGNAIQMSITLLVLELDWIIFETIIG